MKLEGCPAVHKSRVTRHTLHECVSDFGRYFIGKLKRRWECGHDLRLLLETKAPLQD